MECHAYRFKFCTDFFQTASVLSEHTSYSLFSLFHYLNSRYLLRCPAMLLARSASSFRSNVSIRLVASIPASSNIVLMSSLVRPAVPVRQLRSVFLRCSNPDLMHLKNTYSSISSTGCSFLTSSLSTVESILGLGMNASFGAVAIFSIVQ